MNIIPTVVELDQTTPAGQARSGAKAYNCARLKQAGFPVPDGLVILSTATEADVAALPDHPWFGTLSDDVAFAVRSSGIGEDGDGESFAGIHQTLLNVDRADLPKAVAVCRASAYSAQALEYRRAKAMPTDAIAMGVLIQRMVHPVAAGVAFTVNPVTGANDELVINSSWGLGEALVSGQVDPDEFVVGKRNREVRWSRVGEKGNTQRSTAMSLTPDQISGLAALVMAIERHYGTPQDVEWCHDGRRFWVVQSRPVTTASSAGTDETEWTRANMAEVLPDLTSPQALAVFEEMLDRAERQYLGSVVAPEKELGPIVKAFHGRLYFNLSQLRRVCAMGNMAPAMMLRSMGHAGAIHPSDEVPPRPSIRALACLPDLLRLMRRHLRAADIVREHEVRARQWLERFANADPRRLADAELWSVIDRWFGEAPEFMQPVLLLGGVLFHEAPVWKACAKVGCSFERLVYPQLAIGERSVSAQQAFDLVALADTARREPTVIQYLSSESADLSGWRLALRGTAFLSAFERFLAQYGHRGRYEYDWSLPRYNEDPAPLLQAVRAHLGASPQPDDPATAARQEREAVDGWTLFEQRLSRWQKWTMLPKVRRAIKMIKQYYVWREQVRSDLVRVLGAMRVWHLVLAERFVERGWLDRREDYFLLHFREIASIVGGRCDAERLPAIVADRQAERERFRLLQMPLLMRAGELPALIRTAGVCGGATEDDELRGQPVSGGCVDAEVVVVRDPGDFGRMKRGAILVAPATDPSWTPLFTLASGVIVEVGGVLSHASTIAREYGLPALANVKQATKRLRTGERVRVDAIHGRVHRLRHLEASGEKS